MRCYVECENCGADYHIDDEDLCFCDICESYVCNQCYSNDDDKIECENCDKLKLEETQDKIKTAKLDGLAQRVDSSALQDMCLKKHHLDVKHVIKELQWLIKHGTTIIFFSKHIIS
jgi:hypothetical protein